MNEENATGRSDAVRVGLLGTGLMGTAMAHRLLGQSVTVIAWDRAAEHARPLTDQGAEVVRSAGEVVDAADAVITMLPTAQIVPAHVLASSPRPASTLSNQDRSCGTGAAQACSATT